MRNSFFLAIILMVGCAKANANAIADLSDRTLINFDYSEVSSDIMKAYDLYESKTYLFSKEKLACRFLKLANLEVEVISGLLHLDDDIFTEDESISQYHQYFLNQRFQLSDASSVSVGLGALLSLKTDDALRNSYVSNDLILEKTGVPVVMSHVSFNTVQPINEYSRINLGVKVVLDFDIFGSTNGMYEKQMSESQASIEYVINF